MLDKLITIIVPVYNIENYINDCIKSIIEQTYKKFELIIINDGSTDNSGNICDEWSLKDSRIIVIHQKNGGISDARNAGLKIMKGDLISFIDGDDYVVPNFLENMYRLLEDMDCDFVACNYINDRNGNLYLGTKNKLINSEIIDSDSYMHRFYNFVPFYAQMWNKLFKKHLFDNLFFPKDLICEDAYIIIDIVDKSQKIFISDQMLYYYRQRAGSITDNLPVTRIHSDVQWLERHIEFFRNSTNHVLYLKAIHQYCFMLVEVWDEMNKEDKNLFKKILKKRCLLLLKSKGISFKTRIKYGICSVSITICNVIFKRGYKI